MRLYGKFGPQHNNLSAVIRGFKSGVAKQCRQRHLCFHWQSRFHDHIIRNDDDFYRHQQYIIDNPIRW